MIAPENLGSFAGWGNGELYAFGIAVPAREVELSVTVLPQNGHIPVLLRGLPVGHRQ